MGSCAHTLSSLPALFVCAISPALHGQIPDLSNCVTVADLAPSGDVLEFEIYDSLTIGDTQVFLDASAVVVGYGLVNTHISLTSPAGTLVTLHDGTGGLSSDFNVTFYDDGDPYTKPRYSPGTSSSASVFDCGGCLMQPSGPGALSDFDGESTDGVWTLSADLSSKYIHEFCVFHFLEMATRRVQELMCTQAGDGVGEISWTNGEDYEEIAVYVNDLLAASLYGPFVGGETATYSTPAVLLPQLAEIRIVPIAAGKQPAPDVRCHVAMTALPAEEAVIEPSATVTNSSPFEGTVVFGGSLVPADLQVEVYIAGTSVGVLQVEVASPSGTSLVLHTFGPQDSEQLSVIFWDAGVP